MIEKIELKRIVSARDNSNCLLKNTSSKRSKNVVCQKIKHLDKVGLMESEWFFLQSTIYPSERQDTCINGHSFFYKTKQDQLFQFFFKFGRRNSCVKCRYTIKIRKYLYQYLFISFEFCFACLLHVFKLLSFAWAEKCKHSKCLHKALAVIIIMCFNTLA